MGKKGGKKGKKGPVCPPGMSPELFALTQDIPMLVGFLRGNKDCKPAVPIERAQAFTWLWSHALVKAAKRKEIAELGCVTTASYACTATSNLVESAPAAGLLHALSTEEELREQVAAAKAIPNVLSLLGRESSTAETEAVGCLRQLCETVDTRKKVVKELPEWGPVLKVMEKGPTAKSRDEAAQVVALVAKHGASEGPVPDMSSALMMRDQFAAMGVLEVCLAHLSDESSSPVMVQACAQTVDCLISQPQVKDRAAELDLVPKLVAVLNMDAARASLQTRASATGALYQLCTGPGDLSGDAFGAGGHVLTQLQGNLRPQTAPVMLGPASKEPPPEMLTPTMRNMTKVVNSGGVDLLVGLCSGPAAADDGKKKKKKKKKEPPLAPEMVQAQSNAAGCLRRLTVQQPWARQIAASNGAARLAPLTTTKNEQTRWHAQAAMWNISGDVGNLPQLVEAKAPKHYTSTLPTRCFHMPGTKEFNSYQPMNELSGGSFRP